MPYYGRFKTYFWRKGMDYNLNKEREKRLEKQVSGLKPIISNKDFILLSLYLYY